MKNSNSLGQLLAKISLLGSAALCAINLQAQTLGDNLAITGPSAGADGSGFSNTKLVRDGDVNTASAASGTSNQRISVKWGSTIDFNTVILREAGNNVTSWQLVDNDSGSVFASGSTIGSAKTLSLGSVSSRKINLIVNASAAPSIAEIEVYNATGTSSSSAISSSTSSVASSVASSSSAAGQTITYQAEDASITQGSVDTNHSGYTGTGFVNYDNVATSYVEWTVNQAVSGAATLTIAYANGTTTARPMAISVNGTVVNSSLAFNGTGTWDTWATQTLSVNLNAGNNVIRAASTTSDGGPNVDYIQVSGGTLVSSSSSSVVSSSSVASSVSSSVVSSSSSSAVSSSSSSVVVSSSSSSVVSSSASSATSSVAGISAACLDLVNNPNTNWHESSLQSDQEIVKCLHDTLGQAVGYGEQAKGGYDPNGNSHLIVITKSGSVSPEQQVLNAISSEDYNWIVFDKDDYANGGDLAMYRLYCSNSAVLADLDNATVAECMDHNLWCQNHGVSAASCAEEFFNGHLDDAALPIRNEMIMSNTTLDGRGSKSRFLFNGFKIGADDAGAATYTAQNVILTHLFFEGAGHAEDHHLDPDMIRTTGESHEVWIHKNTFKNTGDSAFDVKVGAYNITISFNRLIDVLRATLHGSSDSRTINSQIRTTLHNNLFLTTDGFYNGPFAGNNTARRVPLLRRGSAHLFNNVFYDYRKNFGSVRVGGTLFMESNVFLGGTVIQTEKGTLSASFDEWLSYLTKDDFDGGYFSSIDGLVTFSDDNCRIDNSYQGFLPAVIGGTARDLKTEYSQTSRTAIANNVFSAGQDLVDYTNATAGAYGKEPYNSPLAQSRAATISAGQVPCLQ